MSRKCICYCQLCACKEYAKVLAEKCKLKCPLCQRKADRIVVKDAAGDERVTALRRCKSAATVREKLEEEILEMRKVVVPVQRESSNQTVDEGTRNMKRELAMHRYNETMSAIRKLLEITPAVQEAKVLGHQGSSGQRVAETRQKKQRSLTLRRYVEALSHLMKLVYAISAYCEGEVQRHQEPSIQNAEGRQTMQTYTMLRVCGEELSALEKVTKELFGNCNVEIPDHQVSTSQTVAEAGEHTRWGDLTKHTYEKTKAAFGMLHEAVWASTIAETPIQQAPSDQTVAENTRTLRQVSLLNRCESATFSWEKQCPICQKTQDIDHESRCVSSRLANSVVALEHFCSRHLCYCIESSNKIVRKPKGGETRVCPFAFCRKRVDRVIMNAAPWKPRIVEKEIEECLLCKVKEAIKAAEKKQKTKGSFSKAKEAACKSGDNVPKTRGSTSKTQEEASKSEDRTQKTKAPATREKGETSKAANRAQKTKTSALKAKEKDSKSGDRSKKSKDASSKTTDPDQEAAIPICSAVHGDT